MGELFFLNGADEDFIETTEEFLKSVKKNEISDAAIIYRKNDDTKEVAIFSDNDGAYVLLLLHHVVHMMHDGMTFDDEIE